MMTTDHQTALDVETRNFLKILAVVDRTILSRRVHITAGSNRLILTVARRRASMVDQGKLGSAESRQRLAAAIVGIARGSGPIAIRVEASPTPPADTEGFTAVEIVNGQMPHPVQGDRIELQNYQFTSEGWPLAAPPEASLATVAAVAGFALVISKWQGRHLGEVKPPMLMLAISQAASPDLSVSVGDDVVVALTGLAQLGQVVSKWQSGLKHDENTGR
jgi:hypothetical protein